MGFDIKCYLSMHMSQACTGLGNKGQGSVGGGLRGLPCWVLGDIYCMWSFQPQQPASWVKCMPSMCDGCSATRTLLSILTAVSPCRGKHMNALFDRDSIMNNGGSQ